ncbi:MAG: M20/M25/M40 family metallo-hydrolase [Nocardioidaceae bacterium]
MRISRAHIAALTLTSASALLVSSLVTPTASAGPDPDKDSWKLRQAVTVAGMTEHLDALQTIADEHGDRAAGRPGYEASARYVERVLHKAGYETERQYFPFQYEETLAESLTENAPTSRDIDVHVMGYSPNTPEGGITGDLVAPVTPTGCNAAEWGGVDATGMIALVSRGACTFSAKSLAAAEAGALAVIVYNNADGELSGTLGGENPDHIPSGGILQADGQDLLAEMETATVNVTMELRVFKETRETFNVITQSKGGDPDNVVMLGAHLDSVQDGAGINDNGTGSSALLEIAEQLTKFKKLNNTVRFAWWGAEESGLVGSTYYVNDLVTNDPDGLDAIATYLNFDMIGSPNYIIGVYDADASTYPPTAPVPPGSVETEQVFRDYFDSIGQDVVDYQFSGRSDYQAFINNGVASGGLSTGSNGLKSDYEEFLFGGASGVSYDPNYHSPEDDITNVAFDALDIQSDAIAHAVITLAYDTSPVEPAGPRSGEYRLAQTALPSGVVR